MAIDYTGAIYNKDLDCYLKEIEEAPDYYISSKGFVINKNTGKIRQGYKNRTGKYDYFDLKIGLSIGSKNKRTQRLFTIHRLVAKAFITNPQNLPCVDHIDGDTTNNDVSNLRWVTHKQNSNNPITQKHRNSPYPIYCVEVDRTIMNPDELKEILKSKVSEDYITYCFANAMKGKGIYQNNKKSKIKSFAGLHFRKEE